MTAANTKRSKLEAGIMTEEPVGAPVTPAQRIRQLRAAQEAQLLAQQQKAQLYTAKATDLPAAGKVKQAATQSTGAQQAPDSEQDTQQTVTLTDSPPLRVELSYLAEEPSAPLQGQYGQDKKQYSQPKKQYNQGPEQYSQPKEQYNQGPEQYSQPQRKYYQGSEQYSQPKKQYSQGPKQYSPQQKQYSQEPEPYSPQQKQYSQGPEQYSQHQKQYNQGPEQYSQHHGDSHQKSTYGPGPDDTYHLRGSYDNQPRLSHKYTDAPYHGQGPEKRDGPAPQYAHDYHRSYYQGPEGQQQPKPYPQPQQEEFDGGAFYRYGSGPKNEVLYLEKPYSPAKQDSGYIPDLEHWKYSNTPYYPKGPEKMPDPAPQYKDTNHGYDRSYYNGHESQEQPKPYPQPQQAEYDGGAFYRYGSGPKDKDSYPEQQYSPAGEGGAYVPDLELWKQPIAGEYHPEATKHNPWMDIPGEYVLPKRPEPYPKPYQHYSAGAAPSHPHLDGNYGHQGQYPQPDAHYEHPQYPPRPHEQYGMGAQPYNPHPDAPHERYPGPDAPYTGHGPDADAPYGEHIGPRHSYGPKDVSDIPYQTPSADYDAHYGEETEPEPHRYHDPKIVSDIPYKTFSGRNYTDDDMPTESQPDPAYNSTGSEYEDAEQTEPGEDSEHYPQSRGGDRYSGARNRPEYPQPDMAHGKRNKPSKRQEGRSYQPDSESPKDVPNGSKRYEQYSPQESPKKHGKAPVKYTPGEDMYEESYPGAYNPRYDYQEPGPGPEPKSGPGYAEDDLLKEFDIRYSWEDMRYDEHYSCGSHDDQGAAPNLVVLVRDSLTPAEWGLGECPVDSEGCKSC
jgi:hypothetical protein